MKPALKRRKTDNLSRRARLKRALIEGLKSEVLVKNDNAKRLFPNIKPLKYKEAVKKAKSNG